MIPEESVFLPIGDCKISSLGWDTNEDDFVVTVIETPSGNQTKLVCRWYDQLTIDFRYGASYGGMPLVFQAKLARIEGWLNLTIDCQGFPEGILKVRCQELQIGETIHKAEPF